MFASIAAGDTEPFALHLPPDLANAVNREVLGKYTRDFWLEGDITLGASDNPGAVQFAFARPSTASQRRVSEMSKRF